MLPQSKLCPLTTVGMSYSSPSLYPYPCPLFFQLSNRNYSLNFSEREREKRGVERGRWENRGDILTSQWSSCLTISKFSLWWCMLPLWCDNKCGRDSQRGQFPFTHLVKIPLIFLSTVMGGFFVTVLGNCPCPSPWVIQTSSHLGAWPIIFIQLLRYSQREEGRE
jgi:hypothetical protein